MTTCPNETNEKRENKRQSVNFFIFALSLLSCNLPLKKKRHNIHFRKHISEKKMVNKDAKINRKKQFFMFELFFQKNKLIIQYSTGLKFYLVRIYVNILQKKTPKRNIFGVFLFIKEC
jgi:hypothetical protein